jgi:hypothetical protein
MSTAYFRDYRTKWIIIIAIIVAIICGGAWKMNKDAEHEKNLERYKGYLALKAYRDAMRWHRGDFSDHSYEDRSFDRDIDKARKAAGK